VSFRERVEAVVFLGSYAAAMAPSLDTRQMRFILFV